MDTLFYLLHGFGEAIAPYNLLIAFAGSLLGTFVGVLPGLGPTAAMAILLPLTTILGPAQGLMMMAAVYYGSMYGGSTTAILINIPGESSSVPTTLDGYPLARQGRAGAALGISAIGSFIAGIIGLIGLVSFAPALASQALRFGPPEYFTVMLIALLTIVNLSGFPIKKSLVMSLFGLLISLVGVGITSGKSRFDYGIDALEGGFNMISIIVGLFAITEVLKRLEQKPKQSKLMKVKSVFPSKKDLKQSRFAILRGSLLGFFLGILPGISATISSFLSYDLEKRVSKHPEKFGKGAIEGVAAPESANNATSSGGFIPLFALGIPDNPPSAVLLAALMIYGLTPGPVLFQQNGEMVWTVIASMFVGNVILIILNLPLVGLWAKLTEVPFGIMGPVILMVSIVGAYSVRNSLFDVVVAIVFGILGYFFDKYHWPVIPLVLGVVLGPGVERSFIQSMEMSSGNLLIFVERPIALTIIIIAMLLLVLSIFLAKRTVHREKVEREIHFSQL